MMRTNSLNTVLTTQLSAPRWLAKRTPVTPARGFSLLELAIALSVLAVLTGGFLKGRELLSSARAQSTIDQLIATETAIAAFESRFNALPGDFLNASNAVSGGSGNNSGAIDSGTEAGRVFAHLSSAGLIKGSYTAVDASNGCTPAACPSNPFGGVMTLATATQRVGANSIAALELMTGANIPAKQLAEIDRKMDDGNPRTGVFRAHSDEAFAGCINTTGWDESGNPRNCAGIYVIQ